MSVRIMEVSVTISSDTVGDRRESGPGVVMVSDIQTWVKLTLFSVLLDTVILGFFEEGSITPDSWPSNESLTDNLEELQRARGETLLLASCFR